MYEIRLFLRMLLCVFMFFSIEFPLSVLFILVVWFLFERMENGEATKE